jgi:hypothetical protein
MNETNTYYGIILHRMLNRFQHITYHGVPVINHMYYQLIRFFPGNWRLNWAKDNLAYWRDDASQMNESEVYGWSDQPYCYEPHPGGIILMRAGFGDIASLYLPSERFFLLSPNQAEVDVIKLNRPDLVAHNIENYYQENPKATAKLIDQFAQVIAEQTDDPILGSQSLLDWFKNKIPEVIRGLDAAQSLFQKFNIGAVLTISSIYWMDSALNLIAKANRIPSLTVQHGLIDDDSLFGHVPILATKKMVWGKATVDWYKKYGYPESRMSVVGGPRFDIIFNQMWCGREKLRQILGIDPSQKVIVYATGTDIKSTASVIVEGLRAIPNLFLLLSLHPSESGLVDYYQRLTENYPNSRVVRYGEISLYDSLSGADFFVTHCSTAALEAMLFKLPVITVEITPPHFSYGELGASLRVTNASQLMDVVERLMADKKYQINAVNQYQKFLSQYCIDDGLASKRLFDEVELLCHTGGMA